MDHEKEKNTELDEIPKKFLLMYIGHEEKPHAYRGKTAMLGFFII